MLKKLFRLFKVLSTESPQTGLRATFPVVGGMNNEERIYHENAQGIALSNLKMQHEALNHTLEMMYRAFIVSFLALIVAILAVVITYRSHTRVTVNMPVEQVRITTK